MNCAPLALSGSIVRHVCCAERSLRAVQNMDWRVFSKAPLCRPLVAHACLRFLCASRFALRLLFAVRFLSCFCAGSTDAVI